MRTSADPMMMAPGYFDRAGDAICRIAGARTEAEAVLLLRHAARYIGADVAMFCSLVHDQPLELRFMLACDPQWYLEYERSVFPSHDPWITYAAGCGEPACASQIPVSSPSQARALELARRFGFESTLVVPSPSIGAAGRLGLLVLGSPSQGFFERDSGTAIRVMARSLSMELNAWRLSQSRRELIHRAQLTATDIDLLRRERKGHGTKEIARQICMTAQAIDSRFQRLNARLGVPSRKAAASLAASYGLV